MLTVKQNIKIFLSFLILVLLSVTSFGQGTWNGKVTTWKYDFTGYRYVNPDKMKGEDWLNNLNENHPRLFINKNMLADFRIFVLNKQKSQFDILISEVDLLPDSAPFLLKENMVKELPSGEKVPLDKSASGVTFFKYNGSYEAVKLALAYLVNGDEKYLQKAKSYLRLFNDILTWTAANDLNMEHTGYSRVSAFVAYDWICSDLTTQEKDDILRPLLEYTQKAQRNGEFTFDRTWGSAESANYGENALVWYAGLAAYGQGVNDALAETFLRDGAKLFVDMLNHREVSARGTGTLGVITPTYSFGDYPHATFNFFHTWKSAFNEDLSKKWTQMLNYPTWFDWSTIKIVNGKALYHGIGDLAHEDNFFGINQVYSHFAQIVHFYSQNSPSSKIDNVYAGMHQLAANGAQKNNSLYPFIPFLLSNFDEDKVDNTHTKTSLPYFYTPTYGLLLMRSGEGNNDTYSSFRFGSSKINHQHYDELSFVIYKKNFLALDAGSRTITAHQHNFGPQTVAHNTILIHQPGEAMPIFTRPSGFQDDGNTYYNHGGQSIRDKARALALISDNDFIYAAGDATRSYSDIKSKEVVRQFFYLKPDIFIVYDRVVSVNQDQNKEFLLHFQNEPSLNVATKEWGTLNDSKLMVKTILPLNPKFNIVGGKGREFEASGRNWELPGGEQWDETMKVTGKWRVEVSDTNKDERTNFLHVIQANENLGSMMVETSLEQTATNDILTVTEPDGSVWTFTYNRTGEVGLTVEKRNHSNELLYRKELQNIVETVAN